MNLSGKYEAELDKIWWDLDEALTVHAPEERRDAISAAQKRVEQLKRTVSKAAARLRQKGGQKTAERGPDYFRQIAAMRKTRAGGRPKKDSAQT